MPIPRRAPSPTKTKLRKKRSDVTTTAKSKDAKPVKPKRGTGSSGTQTESKSKPKRSGGKAPTRKASSRRSVKHPLAHFRDIDFFVNVARFISAMSEIDGDYIEKFRRQIRAVINDGYSTTRAEGSKKMVNNTSKLIDDRRTMHNRAFTEDKDYLRLVYLELSAPKSAWFPAKIKDSDGLKLGINVDGKWLVFDLPEDEITHRSINHCFRENFDVGVLESCYGLGMARYQVEYWPYLKSGSFLRRLAKHVGGKILDEAPQIGDRLVIPWSVCCEQKSFKGPVKVLSLGEGCMSTSYVKESKPATDGLGDWTRTVEQTTFTGDYDVSRATAVWEVVDLHYGGGGYGHGAHDYYPNGLRVSCKREDSGRFQEFVHFYVTGCFTCQVPIESLIIIE